MIEIKPLSYCDAEVSVPGSKSYTHRGLIISSLAEGDSYLINPLRCEDTDYTVKALKSFGIEVTPKGDPLCVRGRGGNFEEGEVEIFVGNSGSTMRFLTALSALRRGRTILTGDERMKARPIGELVKALKALGIRTHFKEKEDYPPVIVESSGLNGGDVEIGGKESSQYLSALLMVSPYAKQDVYINIKGESVSKPYIDMTLSVMEAFGVEVERDGNQAFFIRAGQRYHSRRYQIEGDASSSSYFFLAAAITGGKVRVRNFNPNSIQGDVAFLDILEKMGCRVRRSEDWAEVRGGSLKGMEIDMGSLPDLVPTVAVLSAFACGKTLIKNIGHLRLKESDRISVLAQQLERMGLSVEEGRDWLGIEGGKPHGTEIETYNDHRIAMSFAIAGLVVSGVRIKGEECVEKSFPSFWETLRRLYP